MTAVHAEIEIKYAVDDAFELPSLPTLAAGAQAGTPLVEGEVLTHRLEATYFDTPDLLLARAHLTLRRRTGGDDAGWHLKIPGADESRQEIRVPLGRAVSTVPAALRRMVRAQLRGQALVPVGRITTERTVHHLVDATGQVVVEVADDKVEAQRLRPTSHNGTAAADTVSWREIEVELRDGDRELLSTIDARLRELGLQVAPSRSKLGRLLGVDAEPETGQEPGEDAGKVAGKDEGKAAAKAAGQEAAQDAGEAAAKAAGEITGKGAGKKAARRAAEKAVGKTSSAGEVVLRYVGAQLGQILANDPQVRVDAPGSVHQMRVATRRLRSALRTFGPVLDKQVVTPLRPELKWLAAQLGVARDAEVMRERLVEAVQAQQSELPGQSAVPALDHRMSDAYGTAREGLLRELDSERYHLLVDRLHALVADPPLTEDASAPASDVLPRRARRAYRALAKQVDAAHEAPNGAERDTHLHEARKAAKKARYAGETLAEVFGKRATRFAAAMETLQEELGEHQDSVVMRARLVELAQEDATVEAAFAYGRLHAQEEERGTRAVARFEDSWKKASRKSVRSWM